MNLMLLCISKGGELCSHPQDGQRISSVASRVLPNLVSTDALQTMEETGFDISSRISKEDFIEVHVGIDGLKQQRSRLFIIQGVSLLPYPP